MTNIKKLVQREKKKSSQNKIKELTQAIIIQVRQKNSAKGIKIIGPDKKKGSSPGKKRISPGRNRSAQTKRTAQ